ncbi:MAG TPA: malate dehydrogenase [Nitrospiria bacterium]|nr:malate dehydrogenase [Nitrospiria bacterium]
MKRAKITIVGAGNVGGSTAQRVVADGLGDVVLIDIEEGLARGKALDLAEAASLYRSDCRVTGGSDYAATAHSDIVVITSGSPRKPGMSRDDLLKINTGIVRQVTEQVARHSPQAVLIIVSNPLDAMTYVAHRVSRFPPERVVGMAGALDAARFKAFLAEALSVSVNSIETVVLGGHGDTMVPLTRQTTIGGVPVASLLPEDRLEAIVQRVRDGGAEIVNLLKTGSAYFAPSAAVAEMVRAVVLNQRKLLPCAAYCRGEYGVQNLFVGVPALLGSGGVERIVPMELTARERAAFQKSVDAVQDLCRLIDRLL